MNDIVISLDGIASYWHLDNWEQDWLFFNSSLIELELVINIADAHLISHFYHSINNIRIENITHASQSNNTFTYTKHLNLQLNSIKRIFQTINMKEKMMKYIELFRTAPDVVQAIML